jgi:hypothetical protein
MTNDNLTIPAFVGFPIVAGTDAARASRLFAATGREESRVSPIPLRWPRTRNSVAPPEERSASTHKTTGGLHCCGAAPRPHQDEAGATHLSQSSSRFRAFAPAGIAYGYRIANVIQSRNGEKHLHPLDDMRHPLLTTVPLRVSLRPEARPRDSATWRKTN